MDKTKSKTKIIFDARPVSGVYTGLGRFTGELAIALVKHVMVDDGIDFVIIFPDKCPQNRYVRAVLDIRSNNVSIVYSNVKCVSLRNYFLFGGVVKKLDGDIYIYPHFDLPLALKTTSMIVIHDLFPLVVDNYFPKMHWLKSKIFYFITLVSCLKARIILSVSKTTKQDIAKLVSPLCNEKTKVIYEGLTLKLDQSYSNNTDLMLSAPSRRFLLYVGDRRPHKNLSRILELYKGLVNDNYYDGDLIIVGDKRKFDFDLEQHLHQGVICVGNVDDAMLDMYYRNCDALVFMSKYEGFGLPILEAASRGRRIITSDGGALAEIAPRWAYVIKNSEPLSQHYLSLSRYLNSNIDTSNLTQYMQNYKWEVVADRIFAHLDELIVNRDLRVVR